MRFPRAGIIILSVQAIYIHAANLRSTQDHQGKKSCGRIRSYDAGSMYRGAHRDLPFCPYVHRAVLSLDPETSVYASHLCPVSQQAQAFLDRTEIEKVV